MQKSAVLLITIALLLIIIYLSIQPPYKKFQSKELDQGPTTAATTSTADTTTKISTTWANTTTPSEVAIQTNTATPHISTTSTRATPRQQDMFLNVWIEAPSLINTTKLPVTINYTVHISGPPSARYALVDNKLIVLNNKTEIKKSLKVNSTGVYRLEIDINGTKYYKTIKVYYYTPKLLVEPIKINVTKIPINYTVVIKIKNVGNATGKFMGYEIPPGSNLTAAMKVVLNHAGYHPLHIDNLTIPVTVYYLHKNYTVTFEPEHVELLPGEKFTQRIYIKNTGNATISITFNNKTLFLKPGEETILSRNLEATTSGDYYVDVSIDNTKYLFKTNVGIIFYKFIVRLKNYIAPPAILTPTAAEGELNVEVETLPTTLELEITANVNSTRYLTFIVDGVEYKGTFTVTRSLQLTKESREAQLTLQINSTKYSIWIKARVKPPKVQAYFSKIKFDDKRQLTVEIECIIYRKITIYAIRGEITYSKPMLFSGEIETSEGRFYFNGNYSDGRGVLKLYNQHHMAVVKFSAEGDNIKIEEINFGGQTISCPLPSALTPRYITRMVTPGEYRLDELAVKIYNMFARDKYDEVKTFEYDGEKVLLVDGRGRVAYFYQDLSLKGDLQVILSS